MLAEQSRRVNIQVIGTNKCQITRKALRFFKERNVPFQFVDLAERGLSRGELEHIAAAVPLDELVDREGREFARLGLSYLEFDTEEELLEHPLLLRTPIVRSGREAAVGDQTDCWRQWLRG